MTRLRPIFQAYLSAAAAIFAFSANAHEFWIDPVDATLAPGSAIVGDLRVGENMKGSGNIFNPNGFTYFSMHTPEGEAAIEGRMGDRPALSATAGSDGLHVIGHMTTARKLTYQKFEKFETFVRAHGQEFAVIAHEERGLPKEDFTEAYFRCAKALIKVGSGAGSDTSLGFPLELVALDNPYTGDGPIRLQLLFKSAPLGAHQVDVFSKPLQGGEASKVQLVSNSDGIVSIPRTQGKFMINSVVLEEPRPAQAEKLDAVWISLWASTTYTIE